MFKNMKIGMRLGLGFSIVLLLMVVLIYEGLGGMAAQNDKMGKIVNENNVKTALCNTMSEQVHIVTRLMRTLLLVTTDAENQAEKEKIDQARTIYNKAREDLEKYPASEQGKAIREKIDAAAAAARNANNKVIELGMANKNAEAIELLLKTAAPLTNKWQDAIDENLRRQQDNNEADVKAAAEAYAEARSLMLLLGAIAVAMGVGIAFWVTRSITRPINIAMDTAQKIATGDLSSNIQVDANDETGQLLAAMKAMTDTLKGVLADTDTLIKAAAVGDLDTRADAGKYHGDFRKLVQGVNETITNIAEPLKLTSGYVDQIAKGVIPAVITTDYKGEYRLIRDNLNTLVKMMGDLLAQTDIIIQGAVNGELEKRANAAMFQGGWNQLVEGINKTLDGIVLPVSEAVEVLTLVEQGDLTRTVKGNYKGQLGDFKDTVNNTVAKLSQTIAEVIEAAD